ncbi:hypothetical protein K501DRAFT_211191 [Backusella circina FSU 941]|nr:hypothetical protein K501DRAFT_211191 [Backusella circina FSU 941]
MSSNQRRDSRDNERPRIEPSFFGNQLRNNDLQPKQQQPKRDDETDWEHPPPPYSPPDAPSSLYPSSSSTPSAPPLHEAIPPVNPNYQRHPTYSTSDNHIYPPHNYNPSYGSIQQQPSSPQSPYNNNSHNNNNTSDASNFHWPWRVESATPPQPNTPPPSTSQSTTTTPTKKTSRCRLFLLILCILFVFLLISNIIGSLFGGEAIHMCTGGVPWAKLPHEINFDDSLRISTTGGGKLTGGRITLKSTDKEHPHPAIFVQSRVSPSDFTDIPGLDYSVAYNEHETHLTIKIPDSVHVCLSMDMEIYVNNKTRTIDLDVQNSPIRIDGDVIPYSTALKVRTTNSPIHFNAPWTGSVLALETTNGNIELRGTVTANSTVSLRTTNNHISTVDILSRDVVSITSTNGYIKTGKLSAEIVRVSTDNAALTVNSIHADQVDLSTTNGNLVVPISNVSSTIKATTRNALLELDLRDSSEEVIVVGETNNNPASLLMPFEFQGTFVIRTTGHEPIEFYDDNTSRIKTHIYHVEEGYMNGARYADMIMGGHITFKTTNAPIRVSFRS